MQNYCKLIGALAAASALVAGTASAEVEYQLHTGYSNEYLFRGQDFGSDLVEAGVNVKSELNGLDLSAGAWYGSFNNNIPGGDRQMDELDLYGEVAKDFGFVKGAIGYIWYMRDNNFALDDSQEVYFSVSREFFGYEASLTYFWGVDDNNDGYTELAVAKGYELSPCLVLNTGVKLGYLAEEGDFTHIQAKVSLDWAFTETATLSPFVSQSWGLGETGRGGSTPYTSRNEFIGGTMLSVKF